MLITPISFRCSSSQTSLQQVWYDTLVYTILPLLKSLFPRFGVHRSEKKRGPIPCFLAVREKASQSFAAAAAKKDPVMFPGGMYGGKHTSRPASVPKGRAQQAAVPRLEKAKPFSIVLKKGRAEARPFWKTHEMNYSFSLTLAALPTRPRR